MRRPDIPTHVVKIVHNVGSGCSFSTHPLPNLCPGEEGAELRPRMRGWKWRTRRRKKRYIERFFEPTVRQNTTDPVHVAIRRQYKSMGKKRILRAHLQDPFFVQNDGLQRMPNDDIDWAADVLKNYIRCPRCAQFSQRVSVCRADALRRPRTDRRCSDTDNDSDRCSVAVWSLESCHTDRSPATNDAGNQGKHRVTKRRAALSNPMFTLVTMLKVKKNKRYILTYSRLSSSAALCFSALLLYCLGGAGKQSGDVTALLSGSQSVQEESRAQRWRTDGCRNEGEQTLLLISSKIITVGQSAVGPSLRGDSPSTEDEESWKRFCLGERLYSDLAAALNRENENLGIDYIKVGFPPLLSIVSRMSQDGNQGKHRVTKRDPALSNPMFTLVTGIVGRWRAVCVTALQRPNSNAAAIRIVVWIAAASFSVKATVTSVLEYLVNWFEERDFTPELGRWLYALLASLEKPLLPEAHSLIRQLARRCSQVRAGVEHREDERVSALNLFICLVGRYFEQRDLADSSDPS
ncbi:unnamed protein product [Ranitomeya imitator]|uniref:Gem-associated protein 2 n=1 Tax=Ranitomeya imitator TaxID=111125 RepID=A0ABN9KTF9_9NEOB|nr:unnamed protein product [Ranitomeya imitator]